MLHEQLAGTVVAVDIETGPQLEQLREAGKSSLVTIASGSEGSAQSAAATDLRHAERVNLPAGALV